MKLPHEAIVPVHRTDGSGDTFIFTQYLSDSTPSWANQTGLRHDGELAGGTGRHGRRGQSRHGQRAQGRALFDRLYRRSASRTPSTTTISARRCLQNKAGDFVSPDLANVSAAVQETASNTPPDERTSLIFAPGPKSYPIINYEYAIVKAEQPSPAGGDGAEGLPVVGDQPVRRQLGRNISQAVNFAAASARDREAQQAPDRQDPRSKAG